MKSNKDANIADRTSAKMKNNNADANIASRTAANTKPSNAPRREAEHIAAAENAPVFEGIVSLRAVLDGGKRNIERVLVAADRAKKLPKELGFLRAKAEERGFALEVVDAAAIDALATGNTHGGLVAVCGTRALSAPDALPPSGFFVALDGVEDPYNFGYALRSLYAAGVDGVLLPPRNWMSAAGIVCRASAGASELLPLYAMETINIPDLFKAAGYQIVCADIENSTPVYSCSLARPLLLVIGGEKRGISAPLLAAATAIVRLDYARPFPAALSTASAASILAFEVYRQGRGDAGVTGERAF